MKKVIASIIAFLLCVTCVSTCLAIDSNKYLGYNVNRVNYENGTFYVDGYFINRHPGCDITQISGFDMHIYDANFQLIMGFKTTDGGHLSTITIPSGCLYYYFFDINSSNKDMSRYDLSYCFANISWQYTYYDCYGAGRCTICAQARLYDGCIPYIPCGGCQGEGWAFCQVCSGSRCNACNRTGIIVCIYCGGNGIGQLDNPPPPPPTPVPTPWPTPIVNPTPWPTPIVNPTPWPTRRKCLACYTGSCTICGGDGVYSYMGYDSPCSACGATGKCWSCGGSGYK